jgi:hypothetical protein
MLEIKAALRIFSKEITFADLKKALGEPTCGYAAGDKYSLGKKQREKNYWSLETSPTKNSTLESHINEILNFMDEKAKEIAAMRSKSDIDIFCMLSSDNGQGTTKFSSSLIKALLAHNIEVILDLYMEPEEN